MWSRHKTNITFIISPVCASISKETMKQQLIDIYIMNVEKRLMIKIIIQP